MLPDQQATLITSVNSYLIYFPFPIDVYHKMPPIFQVPLSGKISFLTFWAGYNSIAILREG